MNIKLLIFPDDRVIITQIEPAPQEDIGDPDLILVEPFVVDNHNETGLLTEDNSQKSVTLSPWMIEYTTQNKFHVHSDKLLTMAEPTPNLVNLYKKAIQ